MGIELLIAAGIAAYLLLGRKSSPPPVQFRRDELRFLMGEFASMRGTVDWPDEISDAAISVAAHMDQGDPLADQAAASVIAVAALVIFDSEGEPEGFARQSISSGVVPADLRPFFDQLASGQSLPGVPIALFGGMLFWALKARTRPVFT